MGNAKLNCGSRSMDIFGSQMRATNNCKSILVPRRSAAGTVPSLPRPEVHGLNERYVSNDIMLRNSCLSQY
ncbi:hypothetical protein FIBSPDRAFT_358376 [Athelia psychrophila]|uniref:Uncharacterized protein n=1 Tax=Athelia psychrophila TaxID=1759441 RepID=A0A166ANN1_9AGAM|nr:hypothetical protein FIBSPDRAFT_175161 [Fibularhizoctonia sp. CBS 109695]KZP26169.1 hypothetical protein FIBSPDRAFT_358376 [Fibularhizoctonia sp. CBS 109695]